MKIALFFKTNTLIETKRVKEIYVRVFKFFKKEIFDFIIGQVSTGVKKMLF